MTGVKPDEPSETDTDRPTRADLGVPDWEDEYLDRVADRLMHNYDLERDVRAGGERFPLYGQMHVENQKQLLHPALNWANHHADEHLFATRRPAVARSDLERLVEVGHALAEEWVDADEEHYGTDFTFVVVVPEVTDDVRSFVADFRDRTLLRFGYYGHYEVNLAVVAPEREQFVASQNADVAEAFVLWERGVDVEPDGLIARIVRRLRG